MSSIFISHSSRDNAIAALIRDWLTGQGYSSQFLDFDPQIGIPAGRNWERELYRQLKAAQAVIALCSENFIASQWCFAEVTQARALGKPVFAVKIDACALQSIFRQEQTVDFAANQGEAFERLARGLQLVGLDPRASFPWNEGRSPFPGLQAFEEADAAVFFGRNEAIQQTLELLARMRRYQTCRFALLLGASGSGKSSLMRAGVLPRLRKGPQEWLAIPAFRPREDPVNELAASIDKALNGTDWKSVREQLRRAAANADTAPLIDLAYDLRTRSNSPDASVLITVDQFEELLGRPPGHPAHVLGEILRLAISSENSPFVVVGVLRSDFLAQFQSLEPWSRLAYENLPIASLGPENMVEIIEKPAQLASIDLEPGFVQAMLADAGRDALPLLAFALRQLWDKFGGLGRFTVQNYLEDIGGMRGLLSRSADEALREEVRSEDVTQSLRRAFSNLVRVTESGQFARQAARWEAMPDLSRAPLECLIKARLLVTWTEKNVRMVEVAHETLFRAWDPLVKWLDADREFLLWQRRLGSARSEWERTHRDDGALLRGGLLAEAETWVAERRDNFSAPDAEFISASVALRQRERTEQEIREWDVRLEAARAFYERSFVLAEQSRFQSAAACLLRCLEIAPRSGAPAGYPSRWGRPAWAEEAWTYFRYLDQQRAHMVARLPGQRGNITSVSLGQGFSIVATGCVDGTMQFWELQTRQSGGTFGESNVPVTCVALGEKKFRILRGAADGQVLLLGPGEEDWKVLNDGSDSGDEVTSVAFSSDEKWVLAGFRLGAIGVWDAETGTPVTGYQDHTGSVTFLACDEERQVIASGSGRPALGGWLGDGGVQLWNMQTRRRVGAVWAQLGDSVGGVAVSADFQTALKGFESGVIQLWKMGTDAELKGELISTLNGHTGSVTSLAFSPDGRRAISGSTDSTARIWDLETGTGLVVLEGHNEAVLTVAFGPSAEWALTGSLDGSIGMWDLGHNQSPRRFAGHRLSVSAVTVSSNGKRILSGGSDKLVRLWDLETCQCLATLGKHVAPLVALRFGADGTTCFSGSTEGSILCWDLKQKRVARVFEGHTAAVLDLSVSPNGRMLLSASSDRTVRLWNADSGELVRVLAGHSDAVYGAVFSADGTLAASGSADGTLCVWDLERTNEPRVLRRDSKTGIHGLAWSPSGAAVIAATGDGTLELWDIDAGKKVRVFKGHKDQATCVVFSPDAKLAVSSSLDGSARLWSVESGKQLLIFKGHDGPIHCVSFSPDGKSVLTGSEDRTAKLWNVQSGEQLQSFKGHLDTVQRVAFSSVQPIIATASSDCRLRLWNSDDGSFRTVLQEGHASEIETVALAADGANAVSASRDGWLCLWDINTGRQITRLPGPASTVASIATCGRMVLAGYGDRFKRVSDPLAFGPVQGRTTLDEAGAGSAMVWDAASLNGARLDRHMALVSSVAFDSTGTLALSGSFDNTARLWDAQSGRQVRAFRGHQDAVWSVALIEGDSYAVTASLDRSIRVWDLRTGSLVRSLEGHTGGVGTVAAIDRTRIVSGSADKSIRVWDVQSGAVQRVFEGHTEGVTSVAVTADGKRIASGSLDKTVRIWDMETGEFVRALEHPDVVWCVAFSPDGTNLVTGCQDAIARVWQVASGRLDRAVQGQTGGINAVIAAADGRIVTGSEGGGIQLWESQAREPLPILENRGGSVLSLALSPDGKRVLSGWEDGLARISNLEGSGEPAVLCEPMGDVLGTAACAQPPRIVLASADCLVWVWDTNGERLKKLAGHTATVTAVALSPDGRIAASGSLDGSVRIWDLESGTTLRVLTGHTKGVLSVAICPDGKAVLSGSADRTVRLWDLETGKQLRMFSGIVAESVAVSPDGRTGVIARGSDIELLPLLGVDVSLEPPLVHAADGQDVYGAFAALYQSVGLRVIREGPGMGELELV